MVCQSYRGTGITFNGPNIYVLQFLLLLCFTTESCTFTHSDLSNQLTLMTTTTFNMLNPLLGGFSDSSGMEHTATTWTMFIQLQASSNGWLLPWCVKTVSTPIQLPSVVGTVCFSWRVLVLGFIPHQHWCPSVKICTLIGFLTLAYQWMRNRSEEVKQSVFDGCK